MMVSGERSVNFGRLGFGGGPAEQAGEHRLGFRCLAAGDQEAWTLRNHQKTAEKDRRRDDLYPEHPPPGGVTKNDGRRTAGPLGDQPVDHERAGEADDDHDLLDRCEPTTHGRRGDLADVDRREHTGRADPEAADEASQDELEGIGGCPRTKRADDEDDRGSDHHVPAPIDVGGPPGGECPDGATKQHRGDVHAEHEIVELEGFAKALLGAVDDPAVVTEHEAADSRHGDDRRDENHVGPAFHIAPSFFGQDSLYFK